MTAHRGWRRSWWHVALRRLGHDLVRYPPTLPVDVTKEEEAIDRTVAPYTMTDIECVVTLVRAVTHVIGNGIEGDFVECGV